MKPYKYDTKIKKLQTTKKKHIKQKKRQRN